MTSVSDYRLYSWSVRKVNVDMFPGNWEEGEGAWGGGEGWGWGGPMTEKKKEREKRMAPLAQFNPTAAQTARIFGVDTSYGWWRAGPEKGEDVPFATLPILERLVILVCFADPWSVGLLLLPCFSSPVYSSSSSFARPFFGCWEA